MKVISRYLATGRNAGPKAKVDIENILKKYYNAKICTFKIKSYKNGFFEKIKKILFCIKNIKTSDLVVVQYPFINSAKVLNISKNKFAIVHDVHGIRTLEKDMLNKEINALNSFQYVIIHNQKMEDYLKEHGLKAKCVQLELFDYLAPKTESANDKLNIDNPIIIYTGGLAKEKAVFLYELKQEKMRFSMNVYGPGLENNKLNNELINYKGCFTPDEIVNNMEGNLGLVWSGEVDESDENIGEKSYMRFNAPHKTSCYLAAGIPVVIWEKAAMADIVKKYNVGYTIKSIYDINNLDFSDYSEKKKKAEELSNKLKEGYFTKIAVDKVLKEIEANNLGKENN